jgi:hypothetical protein
MPDDEVEQPRNTGPLRHVETAQHLTEDTARRLISIIEGTAPIKRIRASQVFSAVLATFGFALVLAGLEIVVQNVSYLDNGWGAILLGLSMLFASGLLLQKLVKGE